MKIKLIAGTILLVGSLLFPRHSSGCQLGLKSVTNFDSSEYIFVGEVTGIVGPFKSKQIVGETWGLVVKPEVVVFLPEQPKDSFEVFTINF